MTSLLCLACAAIALVEPQEAAAPAPPPPAPSAIDVVGALEKVLGDAIEAAEPSVVAIHRDRAENAQETLAVRGKSRRPGQAGPGIGRARPPVDASNLVSFDFGSGVVIGDEGEILTAFHVVKGARALLVRAAGRQAFDAEVIAADPRSDLAVIAPVVEPGLRKPRLKPIPIGDAGALRKGSFLIALGNSFNAAQDGKASASWGILSNVARRIEPDVTDSPIAGRAMVLQLPNYPTLLQLDSKLNLGMSGGAVVNMKGELVGLTTMASSPAGFDAMAGYAIPMDRIGRPAVERLKQGKEVEYGLLGVRPHLESTNRIEAVAPNSPAARGDLQRNDEIIAVNGIPVVDFDSLILAVGAFGAGEEVRLLLRRDGRNIEKTIVLAKYPVEGEVIATNMPPAWRGLRVDYLSMLNSRQAAALAPDATPAGVVVREVEPDTSAARAGLTKWQVITQVGDRPVTDPSRFAREVDGLSGPVTLKTNHGPVVVQP